MSRFIAIIIVALAISPKLHPQGIEGSESLRDRSRVLKKINPVSSETSGFTDQEANTSASDAEGVSKDGFLWNSNFSDDAESVLKAGTSYVELSDEIGYNWNLQHAFSFSEYPDTGIAFDVGQSNQVQRYDTLQYLWSADDTGLTTPTPTTLRLDQRTIDSTKKHLKALAQINLGQTRLFAVAGRSEQDDIDQRKRLEYRFGDVLSNDTQADIVEYDSYRIRKSLRESPDNRTENVLALGAEFTGDRLTLQSGIVKRDWTRERPDIFTVQFEEDSSDALTLDYGKQEEPTLNPLPAETATYDFDYREIRFEDNQTTDEDLNTYLDSEYILADSSFKLTGSAGLLYRAKTRSNVEVRDNYGDYAGLYTLADVAATSPLDTTLRGAYDLGYFPEKNAVLDHFNSNFDNYTYDADSSEQDSISQHYDAEERISAVYVNFVLEWEKWLLSSGIRLEQTEIETFGNEVEVTEDDGNIITPSYNENSYSNSFPTLSIFRPLSKKASILLSWQRSIARPNYYDLIPFRIISRSSEIVTAGNPLLEATILETLSLTYLQELGADTNVAATLSQTKIENFIYTSEDLITEGIYDGFKFRTTLNGDTATIYGLDLTFSHYLYLLADKEKRFHFKAVYQFRDSEAYFSDTDSEAYLLPDVARNKLRVSLGQKLGAFNWLLQADYTSQSLDQFAETEDTFEYLDERLTLNARFGYKINKTWSLGLDLINVTDAAIPETVGLDNRVGKITYNSWQARLGLTSKW